MQKRKFIIPMAAMLLMSSQSNAFASDDSSNIEPKKDEYTEIKYKVAKVKDNIGLNVRKDPKIEKKNRLFVAYAGTEMEILGQQDEWYKVELEDKKEGWINSNYVDLKNEDLYITANKVNFRGGGSLESKIYKELTLGTKVEFLEEDGKWIKVRLGDKEGYIHSNYISDKKPVIQVKPSENNSEVGNVEPNTSIENKIENLQDSDITQNQSAGMNNQQVNNSQNKPNNNQGVNQEANNPVSNESQVNKPANKPENKPAVSPENNGSKISAVINLAYAQIGKPYVWGAEGPNTFDCSGLMTYIFKNGAGINLPRTSKQQSTFGVTVSKDNLQPGDLIFSSTDGSGGVSHVGIYVGNGQMIHSPKPGDTVQKTSINNSYWSGVYLWAKRVM